MHTYIAHYRSPAAFEPRAAGAFEFQSESRAGTKANLHDARMRMLENYGRDAVSWSIERVERKAAAGDVADGQLQLDFRPPRKRRARARRKEWW